MELIKKNIFSITFAVIALLAVGTLYWPISGWYDDLHQQLAARIVIGSSLNKLISAQHFLPILSPDQTVPGVLKVFPTDKVRDAGIEATQEVHSKAKTMLDRAVEANTHQLLVDGELPKPDQGKRYFFAKEYATQTKDYARWKQILNATAPPSDAEVVKKTDDLLKTIQDARLVPRNNPTQESQLEAKTEYDSEVPLVKPRMEMEQASKHSIYLLGTDQNVFQVDNAINTENTPLPDKIAADQIAMWVVDDAVHAIARINQLYSDPAVPGGPPQQDIIHAPIKQIEQLVNTRLMISPTQGDLATGEGTPTAKVVVMSASGRVCNKFYDVVDYNLNLVVDAAKVPLIIRELEYGQLISVLNVQISEVVDPALAATQGYRFGDKPVVHVQLECEELLLRDWLDKYLPESMKVPKDLIPTEATTPGGVINPHRPLGYTPFPMSGPRGRFRPGFGPASPPPGY